MTNLDIEFVDQIAAANVQQWQALVGNDNPFVSYDYLHALETSGAIGPDTGWLAHHLLARDANGALVAAVPLYIKDDSWGEFVFDFAWADAYHRHGIPYYPKLVTAIPYTPVPGPRLLCSAQNKDPLTRQLINAIKAEAERLQCSSWHVLFPRQQEAHALERCDSGGNTHGPAELALDQTDANSIEQEEADESSDTARLTSNQLIVRKDCQFHWFNKEYQSFDHYLAQFRSARRKKCRRERRKVSEAGVTVKWHSGGELSHQEWETFYELYASSFYKRGRSPYFSLDFFLQLSQSSQIKMQVVFAYRNEHVIAAAMFFVTSEQLYGRYWGCSEFVDGLHFELCYYQGIEYCIEHEITQFDPGVQGEHKIARGFQATPSWSTHWLKLPPFADAIRQHIARELEHVDSYMQEVDKHLPFHRKDSDEPPSLD